jgi:hypothetical protein
MHNANALCPLKDHSRKVGGPREGIGGAVRDAMCAATVGNKACERGEACVSVVLNAGGGAQMMTHKGQSKVGDAKVELSSSPWWTNFMLPVLVHTMSMALGCTMGDAMARPTDKANHTSTKRMILAVLSRYCIKKISMQVELARFFGQ